MHVKLFELDSQALELTLSPAGTPPDAVQYVHLTTARKLRGELQRSGASLSLSNAQAEQALIAALRLVFGVVVLEAAGETQLEQVAADFTQAASAIGLQVSVAGFVSQSLKLAIGGVSLAAKTRLQAAKLAIRGEEGRLAAGSAAFEGLRVMLNGVSLVVPDLAAKNFKVEWGAAGFRLEADEVVASSINFETRGTRVRGEQIRAERLSVHDADWSIGGFSSERARAEMDFATAHPEVEAEPVDLSDPGLPEKGASPEPYTPNKPVFDWRILDTISGRLDVDVQVDLKLPFLPRRQAVHRFRLALEDGTVNYRELESCLSALEDALLDFSVRDGDLVLELGLPLLPTRGAGKPLVRWPLTPGERRLAAEHRVRLATLAHPKTAAKDPDAQVTAGGDSPLRLLAFRGLDIDLSLTKAAAPMHALLQSLGIGDLKLKGAVVYRESGQAEHTNVTASLQNIDIELDDFPLTGRKFDLKTLHIESIPRVSLDFHNVKPARLELELSAVNSKSIDFGRFAED